MESDGARRDGVPGLPAAHAVPESRILALLAAVSFLVFIAGGLFFRHTKREFVDVL